MNRNKSQSLGNQLSLILLLTQLSGLAKTRRKLSEKVPKCGEVLGGTSVNKKVRKKAQPQKEILRQQKEGTQPSKLDLNVC